MSTALAVTRPGGPSADRGSDRRVAFEIVESGRMEEECEEECSRCVLLCQTDLACSG